MVDILLATYNGERYVKSQILSIISQTFQDWHLIVHDDGSTDRTADIIKKLMEKDSRITFVADGVICGGAAQNFMHLLRYSDSDYVMFCDQDDIWFDNKVELLYNAITHMDTLRPRVVYSNSLVWKPQIGVLGLATLSFANDLNHLLFLNSGIQGCVSIFDSKIRALMKEYSGVLSMHDHILQLFAVTLGDCRILNIPLMLYRNHDSNVTGDTRTKIVTKESFISNRKRPIVDTEHYSTVNDFYVQFGNVLTSKDKNIIRAYLDMIRMPIVKRMWMVCKYGFKIYDSSMFLLLKILLRPYHNLEK